MYLAWNPATRVYAEAEDGKHHSAISAMEFDGDGYCHLGFSINLARSGGSSANWASFGLVVSETDGKVSAKLSEMGKPYSINFDSAATCNEFYDLIVKEIKQAFANPHTHSPIGFKFGEPEPTLEAKQVAS